MNVDINNPWTWHWGSRYGESLKINIALQGYLAELIESGRLGHIVVDVGSGKPCPIKDVIRDTGARLINVDIAAHENLSNDSQLFIKLDAEKILDANSLEVKEAIKRVSRFLDIDCTKSKDVEPVDTFLLSEIINYIDYQAVIKSGLKWLKPGGRIVIINEPKRGLEDEFSDKGPINNNEVINFLESLGLVIEVADYTNSTANIKIPQALSMMVLVAQKK